MFYIDISPRSAYEAEAFDGSRKAEICPRSPLATLSTPHKSLSRLALISALNLPVSTYNETVPSLR
jgi:hypothetical protein